MFQVTQQPGMAPEGTDRCSPCWRCSHELPVSEHLALACFDSCCLDYPKCTVLCHLVSQSLLISILQAVVPPAAAGPYHHFLTDEVK